MTLKDLKDRCKANEIPYAYGKFEKEVKPPYLIAYITNTSSFNADDSVYYKIEEVELILTYVKKDRELEKLIENNILNDVIWSKSSETYLPSDDLWQVSFYFKI